MVKNGVQGYILINSSISAYGTNGSYDYDYYNLSNTQYWAPGIIAHVKIQKTKDDIRYRDLYFANLQGGSTEVNGS